MEPILVDLPDQGLELKGGRLVILAGQDEEAIADQLLKAFLFEFVSQLADLDFRVTVVSAQGTDKSKPP